MGLPSFFRVDEMRSRSEGFRSLPASTSRLAPNALPLAPPLVLPRPYRLEGRPRPLLLASLDLNPPTAEAYLALRSPMEATLPRDVLERRRLVGAALPTALTLDFTDWDRRVILLDALALLRASLAILPLLLGRARAELDPAIFVDGRPLTPGVAVTKGLAILVLGGAMFVWGRAIFVLGLPLVRGFLTALGLGTDAFLGAEGLRVPLLRRVPLLLP